jgi:hypothetical protein
MAQFTLSAIVGVFILRILFGWSFFIPLAPRKTGPSEFCCISIFKIWPQKKEKGIPFLFFSLKNEQNECDSESPENLVDERGYPVGI